MLRTLRRLPAALFTLASRTLLLTRGVLPIALGCSSAAATTKTATGGGAQGRWVNGVAMYNMLDFFSWSNSAQADQ